MLIMTKYQPQLALLYSFLEDHSIAADSCPGIDDQTNMAQQSAHFRTLD